MSKERELLERAMSLIDYRYAPSEAITVHREIQELLDQPDEQEPVDWMQKSDALYVLEEKSTMRGFVIPLYTAPPKCEPLSEQAVGELLRGGYSTHLHDVVRKVEKAHGIGV